MPASIANGTRPGENRATRSKNPRPQAVHVLTTAPPAQTCFGYVRRAAAIHLEFQRPETRRRAAARERFLRTQDLALLVISNDAEPELRSPLKMFFLEMAIRTPRPATRLVRRLASPCNSQCKRVAILKTRHAPSAFSQLFRRCTRPCSDFQNMLAQFRTGHNPGKHTIPRHAPPNRGSAKPVLKSIHWLQLETGTCLV